MRVRAGRQLVRTLAAVGVCSLRSSVLAAWRFDWMQRWSAFTFFLPLP